MKLNAVLFILLGYFVDLCFPVLNTLQILSMLLDRSVNPDALNRQKQVRVRIYFLFIFVTNVIL